MAPVSGSKKTNNEGIKVIKRVVKINLNSFLKEPFGIDEAFWLKYRARVNFMSSLGWKEKKWKSNQALEPLMDLPKNKTKISKIIFKR